MRDEPGTLTAGIARSSAELIVNEYVAAWVEQDTDRAVSLFTEDALYYERVLDEPIRGREGIRKYWDEKVCAAQAQIECAVLSLYVDGNAAIVEWEARFDDQVERVRKLMREVAILTFSDGLISTLREYWTSRPMTGLGSDMAADHHAGTRPDD